MKWELGGADTCRKNFLNREHSTCKGPEAGEPLACLEAIVAEAGGVGGERWEMGTQKSAVGLGKDFGFSLNRLFSSLWRGGLFVADLT